MEGGSRASDGFRKRAGTEKELKERTETAFFNRIYTRGNWHGGVSIAPLARADVAPQAPLAPRPIHGSQHARRACALRGQHPHHFALN